MQYTVTLKSENTVQTEFGKITVRGGGYDRRGTLLGKALSQILSQDDLKQAHDAGLYGVNMTPDGEYMLDGAKGEESMAKIAKNSGWEVKEVFGRKQALTGWVISKN